MDVDWNVCRICEIRENLNRLYQHMVFKLQEQLKMKRYTYIQIHTHMSTHTHIYTHISKHIVPYHTYAYINTHMNCLATFRDPTDSRSNIPKSAVEIEAATKHRKIPFKNFKILFNCHNFKFWKIETVWMRINAWPLCEIR